nr:hypothetical protein [Desulfobacterales bacterium]
MGKRQGSIYFLHEAYRQCERCRGVPEPSKMSKERNKSSLFPICPHANQLLTPTLLPNPYPVSPSKGVIYNLYRIAGYLLNIESISKGYQKVRPIEKGFMP